MKSLKKITIEFVADKDAGYDQHIKDAILCMNAREYQRVLWDFTEWLRSEIKYRDMHHYEAVREKINELINEANIVLD